MAVTRWLRYQYLRLLRINDDPQPIAMGMAVGVFLGVFPTFGLGAVLAYILAVIFRFNRAAAIIGSLIMNPLTTPLFWSGSAILGTMLVGGDWHSTVQAVETFSKTFSPKDFLTKELWVILAGAARKSLYVYMVGNAILAILFAILSYFLTLKLTLAYRRRKADLLRRRSKVHTP